MKRLALLLSLAVGAPAADAQDFFDVDVLRTVDVTFQDPNWLQTLKNNWASQTNILADMTVEGVTYPDVGVRIRGNSSFFFLPGNAQKVSLNITVDFTDPDLEVMGQSSLNFNNAFSDPTFCREVVYFNILNKWIPSGRANHVIVRINGENWGVYANVQQYGKRMLRDFFDDEDGLRIKCANNPGGPGLQYNGPGPGGYNDYEIKEDGGLADPLGALIAVCDAIDNTPPANWPLVDEVFALDPSIWTLVMENLFSDDDSYVNKGCDFVLYRNPVDGRTHLHQTDGNETWTEKDWQPDHNFGSSTKPLLSNVLSAPELRARYFAHLRAAITEAFQPAALEAEFAARRALIESAVLADTKKLYSNQDFANNFDTTVSLSTFPGSAVGISEYINERRALLLGDAELAARGPAISGVAASGDAAGTIVSISALVTSTVPIAAVDLFYRRSADVPYESIPMLDDGLSGDGAAGDGRYGAQLPFAGVAGQQVAYYVRGTSQNAFDSMTFEPTRTELDPLFVIFQGGDVPSDVVINEFLASNSSVNQDPSGAFEDWVELYNKGGATVDLSGRYLSDSLSTPPSWQFADGTLLAPGEALLVWTDSDPGEGPLHTDFKLSAGGEVVALWDTDGTTVLDSYVFGPQKTDESTGRLFDGGTQLVTFPSPTPGAVNKADCGLRAYDQLDPEAHILRQVFFGSGAIGASSSVTAAGLQPGSMATFAIGFEDGYLPVASFPGVVALIGGFTSLIPLPVDASGLVTVPFMLPNDPLLAGVDVYCQFVGQTPAGKISASNAVELSICP